MKLKQSLFVLFLLFSNSQVQENYLQRTYSNLRELEHRINSIEFQGFNINLREKRISYPSRNDLIYFYIKNNHNGEHLYSLTYSHTFDVQTYIQKLQRASSRGTVKEIRDY